MTVASLKAYTLKDLAQMARRRGVRGWHSMRKDELVRALVASARSKASSGQRPSKSQSAAPPLVATSRVLPKANKAPANGSAANGANHSVRGKPSAPSRRPGGTTPLPLGQTAEGRNGGVLKRLEEVRQQQQRWKDLSARRSPTPASATGRDRLVLMVRDPFWLHASWEVTPQSVERARVALGYHWHTARPVLRLYEVTGHGGSGATAEQWLGDVAIHGGVNNWYLDVQDPPKTYRVDIGYLGGDGKYYSLARSNLVTTPPAAESDMLDQNWVPVAENFDKIFAMSSGYSPETASAELQEVLEERLRRPMGSPMFSRFGAGAETFLREQDEFYFQVEAEVILYGSTKPGSYVTVQGEPVRLRPDGTFTMRMSLPDKRQVIPAVASSGDGIEQRTVVVALERNTKYMEPVVREADDDRG